ncbi:MAG TPA: DUF2383 domain-containing protein [Pseudomonadota bacterium]|nr:DUF2383 domain-containing protein [Pseudomonadota bacterium]
MGTQVATEKEIVSQLNDLIALDYDAIEAYEAALVRLSDPPSKQQLRQFLGDHQRHTVELAGFVSKYGCAPVTKADFKQILTKGKVVLAGLVGDKAILAAMKSNEDDTNSAYERAIAKTGLPESIRVTLNRNLLDERRHRAWIEQRLQQMDVPQQAARF